MKTIMGFVLVLVLAMVSFVQAADYTAVTKDDEVASIDQVVVKEAVTQTAESQSSENARLDGQMAEIKNKLKRKKWREEHHV